MSKATTPMKPTERDYQLFVKPLVTEKTAKLGEANWYTFEVPLTATKPELKAAFQRLYSVDVIQVNTLIQKGKLRSVRAFDRRDRRPSYRRYRTVAQAHPSKDSESQVLPVLPAQPLGQSWCHDQNNI